jgi:hypothetical protein
MGWSMEYGRACVPPILHYACCTIATRGTPGLIVFGLGINSRPQQEIDLRTEFVGTEPHDRSPRSVIGNAEG